jgi:hypothetical protein
MGVIVLGSGEGVQVLFGAGSGPLVPEVPAILSGAGGLSIRAVGDSCR